MSAALRGLQNRARAGRDISDHAPVHRMVTDALDHSCTVIVSQIPNALGSMKAVGECRIRYAACRFRDLLPVAPCGVSRTQFHYVFDSESMLGLLVTYHDSTYSEELCRGAVRTACQPVQDQPHMWCGGNERLYRPPPPQQG
jgi:hypothetical protein